MNTLIHYLYRDANNYKAHHEIIVRGAVTFADVTPFLDSGEFFIPSQVGLPDLQSKLGQPTDDDHVWHHLTLEDFTPTSEPPTVKLTARDLRTRFRRAHATGWDISAAMDHNNIELSERDLAQLQSLFARAGYSSTFDRYMESLSLCQSFPLPTHTTPQA